MTLNRKFVKLCSGAAVVIATLAMTAPMAAQAATTIVIDNNAIADGCGKLDGSTAETNPVAAIGGAATGSTIMVCPGTYALGAKIVIDGKKLTIKRALSDVGQTPTFTAAAGMNRILEISGGSAVTIDGLIIDGKASTQGSYHGIDVSQSALTLKNATILGPNQSLSKGININNGGLTKALNVSISSTSISGYQNTGVETVGAVKLTVKSCYLDATDGGRVTTTSAMGVDFRGATDVPVAPTGSVSKSTIVNQHFGVVINESSKVSVASNMLANNKYGLYITTANNFHNADGNKVTGNTIVGVPADGTGIFVNYVLATSVTMKSLNISKNLIYAAQYTPSGAAPNGIYVQASSDSQTKVTGTISGNTLWGFPVTPSPLAIVNEDGNAGVKIGKNVVLP